MTYRIRETTVSGAEHVREVTFSMLVAPGVRTYPSGITQDPRRSGDKEHIASLTQGELEAGCGGASH